MNTRNTRADVEAAFDELDTTTDPVDPVTPDPVDPVTPDPVDPVDSGSIRDSLGRFVKPEGGEIPATPVDPTAQAAPVAPATPPVDPAQAEVPAPVSWTPVSRETWKDVPAPARAEILRREQEITNTLQETANARQIAGSLQEVVMPFMGRIQAQRLNPFQAIQGLFNTEMTLGTGTKLERANKIAELIKTYDIDLVTLDETLAGMQPSGGVQNEDAIQRAVQQAIAPFQNVMSQAEQFRTNAAQQSEAKALGELQTFAQDAKNEFYNDVRETMADLLEVSARRGINMTLQQAYDQAVTIDPRVGPVFQQRRAAAETARLAQEAQARVGKARRAAVSITGAPVLGSSKDNEPEDLRSAISAAIDASSRV